MLFMKMHFRKPEQKHYSLYSKRNLHLISFLNRFLPKKNNTLDVVWLTNIHTKATQNKRNAIPPKVRG